MTSTVISQPVARKAALGRPGAMQLAATVVDQSGSFIPSNDLMVELTGPGASQRDSLVDHEVIAAVDQERAGRELHDLPYGADVDGGLN